MKSIVRVLLSVTLTLAAAMVPFAQDAKRDNKTEHERNEHADARHRPREPVLSVTTPFRAFQMSHWTGRFVNGLVPCCGNSAGGRILTPISKRGMNSTGAARRALSPTQRTPGFDRKI